MSSTVSVLPSPSIQMARSLLSCPVEDLIDMSPFDLFKRQMESGSTEAAIDAMKRTSVVAVAMGSDSAVADLLPYLTAVAMQQPPHADELLLILGQQLVYVTEFCGYQTADQFLPMLERLAAIEETVVRDQGVTCITAVCELVIAHNGKSSVDAPAWVGLAKRLAAADWFTAKVSACGVTAPMFRLTGDEDLLHTFKELTMDETPMVRRAAAKYLGKVLNAAGWQHKDIVVAALPALIRDEQDSVRLLAVAALAEAGPSYGEHCAWTIQHWLPLLKDGCIDMSWYVFFLIIFVIIVCIILFP
jgi:serine/threonine-protein phosphatase 2A regulatory subunit A